jgi:hypothetical protein
MGYTRVLKGFPWGTQGYSRGSHGVHKGTQGVPMGYTRVLKGELQSGIQPVLRVVKGAPHGAQGTRG